MKRKRSLLLCLLCLLAGLFCFTGCKARFDYRVEFYVDEEIYRTVGTNGQEISMPPDPYKEGYVFDGWYVKTEDGKETEFTVRSLPDMPLSKEINLEVYARFESGFTVIFATFTDEKIAPVSAWENSLIEEKTPSVRPEGKVFDGWYRDTGYRQKWDFDSDRVTADITLYAKWADAELTVSYVFDRDGCADRTLKVAYGNYAENILPQNEEDRRHFIGWYKDEQMSEKWDFSKDRITENLVLYADWDDSRVTVVYCYRRSGLSDEKIRVKPGELLPYIDPPFSPGNMRFAGWYTDETLTREWDFWENRVAEDLVLYAKWKGDSCAVRFVCPDGSEEYEYLYEGEFLAYRDCNTPVEEWQTFDGWYVDGDLAKKWDFVRDEARKDLVLYAYVSTKSYSVTFDFSSYSDEPLVTEKIKFGDVIPQLGDAQKDDYALKGYYAKGADGKETALARSYEGWYLMNVAEDVTVYPKWIYALVFTEIRDGTAYAVSTGVYDEETGNTYGINQNRFVVPVEHNGKPVKEIPAAGFSVGNIGELVVPAEIETIGENAFKGVHVRFVTIAAKTIGRMAFFGNPALTLLTLEEGVETIGESAFEECWGLQTLTFAVGTLRSIGDRAFSLCDSITEIRLPAGLQSIGTNAFVGCDVAEAVFIPSSVSHVGNGAFGPLYEDGKPLRIFANTAEKPAGWDEYWCSVGAYTYWNADGDDFVRAGNGRYLVRDGYAVLLDYKSDCGSFALAEIPSHISVGGQSLPVTEIADRAFFCSDDLRKLILPDTLERLSPEFLYQCDSVEYLEEGCVRYLGSKTNPYLVARYYASGTNVKTLTVKKEVKFFTTAYYSYHYTYMNGQIENLVFEEGCSLRSIFAHAFPLNAKEVYIPAGITYIAESAFVGKTGWYGLMSCARFFVAEKEKPVGWADGWADTKNDFGENFESEVYWTGGGASDVTIGEIRYMITDGEATILDFGERTGKFFRVPSAVTVDGISYPVTMVSRHASSAVSARYVFVPAEIARWEYASFGKGTEAVFSEREDADRFFADELFFRAGVFFDDFLFGGEVDYILSDGTAEAFLPDTGRDMLFLPSSVSSERGLYTVAEIAAPFIYKAARENVSLIVPRSVTKIVASYPDRTGTIYTAHGEKPEDWTGPWLSRFRIVYGVTADGVERTYTFETSGTPVLSVNAYLLPSSPATTAEGKVFWDWYDNADFAGLPVSFPYWGEKTTLYARFEAEAKQDGKEFATAYRLQASVTADVSVTSPGQIVYFRFDASALTKYTFKSKGNMDTYAVLYDDSFNRLTYADGGGAGENFSFDYTFFPSQTCYIAVKLVDKTETGDFQIIVSAN